MGRRTRELILAAVLIGGLGWGVYAPVYQAFVLTPAMARAVKKMDSAAIRRLALDGADVNLAAGARNGGYPLNSPLRIAVGVGDAATLRVLIERGADIHRLAEGEPPLLIHAAATGIPETVEILLNAGADVKALDVGGGTALTAAVDAAYAVGKEQSIRLVELLLRRGADPHVIPEDDFTALARAEEGGHAAIARILRATGSPDRDECLDRIAAKGPLYAVRSGKFGAVKRLVRKGVSFRVRDEEGTTLTAAAKDWAGSLLPYLLKHARGIDRAFLNEHEGRGFGDTPLTATARRGCLQYVKVLLAAGADPNLPNAWGHTALHRVAMIGDLAIARQLLASRAEVNVRDEQGRTPLHWAIQARHRPMEKLLRAAGAAD